METLEYRLKAEFDRGEAARARGNEGQARVCARRAAGIAIREYLERRGETVRISSAYDLLSRLIEDPLVSGEVKQAAAYLTMRVDKDFKLPADVDLLAESRRLCDLLLSG
jgi:hypothetical protein